jgi:hypothetical protein
MPLVVIELPKALSWLPLSGTDVTLDACASNVASYD